MKIKDYLIEIYLNNLKTYKNWKLTYINPKKLALANLFYTGKDDIVKCPDCEIEIYKWERNDDPMNEHISKSPNCAFVKSFGNFNFRISENDIFVYLCAYSNIIKEYIKSNIHDINHIKKGVLKHIADNKRNFDSFKEINHYFQNVFVENKYSYVDSNSFEINNGNSKRILFVYLKEIRVDQQGNNLDCPICGDEIANNMNDE